MLQGLKPEKMGSMKTPITYYGGKQSMLKYILPLIPPHETYTEAFFGGGAVFWAKEPSAIEVINDTKDIVIIFYEQLKTNFNKLNSLIQSTAYSRALYKKALVIYEIPHLFSPLQQAWAFWILTNQGFSSQIGSWGYSRNNARSRALIRKKDLFTKDLSDRLEQVQIESNDAITVIQSRDTPKAFHYIDPPYVHSDQGHYKGYTEDDYILLLNALTEIKGKFLLSSYPSEILDTYIKKNGWHTKSINKPLSTYKTKRGNQRKRKVEVLTANYPI